MTEHKDKVNEERLEKALKLCNLQMTSDIFEEFQVKAAGAAIKGSYNPSTGELVYSPEFEDSEEIQCLKRTLASEPTDV